MNDYQNNKNIIEIKNKLSKLWKQYNDYINYTNILKKSFKRNYNELKLENIQLKYEINELKNTDDQIQIKELKSKISNQMMTISKLNKILEALFDSDDSVICVENDLLAIYSTI